MKLGTLTPSFRLGGNTPSRIYRGTNLVWSSYDVEDYFARIVAAGSSISEGNKAAVRTFVSGCQSDGIFNAIKACCILAGADTLAGALVPLVGAVPANLNFVPGDYNRVTGLLGNGTNKYLNSNRNNNAEPKDNQSLAIWIANAGSVDGGAMLAGRDSASSSGSSQLLTSAAFPFISRGSAVNISGFSSSTGTFGVSRSSASGFTRFGNGTSAFVLNDSVEPSNASIKAFARGSTLISNYSNSRLSFYSIGESLNLAQLDARLATLMSSLT